MPIFIVFSLSHHLKPLLFIIFSLLKVVVSLISHICSEWYFSMSHFHFFSSLALNCYKLVWYFYSSQKFFICFLIKTLFKKTEFIAFQLKQQISFKKEKKKTNRKTHNFLYRATAIHLSLLWKSLDMKVDWTFYQQSQLTVIATL